MTRGVGGDERQRTKKLVAGDQGDHQERMRTERSECSNGRGLLVGFEPLVVDACDHLRTLAAQHVDHWRRRIARDRRLRQRGERRCQRLFLSCAGDTAQGVGGRHEIDECGIGEARHHEVGGGLHRGVEVE